MFSHGSVPQEAFQNLPSLAGEDYYKQYVPYYDRTNTGTISNDELTQKLDYMIHLLEEQLDLRTGHVTEEHTLLILEYLFLFLIHSLELVNMYVSKEISKNYFYRYSLHNCKEKSIRTRCCMFYICL